QACVAVRMPGARNHFKVLSPLVASLLVAYSTRIDPVSQKRFGLVALGAGDRQGCHRVFAEAEQPFSAVEAVLEAPQFGAVRLDEQMQAAAIRQLEGPLAAFDESDFKFLERHLGVSPCCVLRR